jgi:hypothetical protein
VSDRGILSSLRYLFADFIGEDDDTPPFCPRAAGAGDGGGDDAIHLLIEYQGTSYAELTSTGCGGFVGKQGVDDAMLAECTADGDAA